MPGDLRRWAPAFWPPGRRRDLLPASAESWRTGNSPNIGASHPAVDASPYYAPGPTAPPQVSPLTVRAAVSPGGQTGERDPGLQPPLPGAAPADFARGLPDNLRNAAADLKGRAGVKTAGSRDLKEGRGLGGWLRHRTFTV